MNNPDNSIRIEELNLSVRAYNALKRAGFETVDQVSEVTPRQLLRFRGMGETLVEEICEKVRAAGYSMPT